MQKFIKKEKQFLEYKTHFPKKKCSRNLSRPKYKANSNVYDLRTTRRRKFLKLFQPLESLYSISIGLLLSILDWRGVFSSS